MDVAVSGHINDKRLCRVHKLDWGGVFASHIYNRVSALESFVSVTDSVNHLVLPHTIFTINKLFFNVYIT